jgi:hypothetical protein
MKKIILVSVILFAFVFSFEKSFGKRCLVVFNVGGTSYIDNEVNGFSISADTLFNVDASINLPITVSVGGSGACVCTTGSVWWVHNSSIISNSLSYTVTDTGVYIINVNADGGTGCVDVVDSYRVSTSVNELSKANFLQIYPNPTNNTFTIKNISSNEVSLLQIMNPVGEVAYTEKLFGKKEYVVDANLAKGIYFVRVEDGKSNVTTKLVVE